MTGFPAGTGETMQYLVHAYNDNTIRFILTYPGRVDASRLCAAARAMTSSVEVLHASFIPGKRCARWQVNADVPEAAYFACVRADRPLCVALEAAAQPIDPGDAAQLHVTLAQGAAADAVAVRISHLCVDGGDGRYLLEKLIQAYADPAALQVKNGSRRAEQAYDSLPAETLRALKRIPRGGAKTAFPYTDAGSGRGRIITAEVGPQVMAAVRRRMAGGATVNDLLLTACFHALARQGVSGAMSIMSMVDLRRHCPSGDSEGLSNLSGQMSTCLPDGPCADFADTLAQVAQLTRAAKAEPYAGMTGLPLLHMGVRRLPLAALQRLIGRVYGSFTFGVTNLGVLQAEKLQLDDLRPDWACFAGPVKKKPGTQVSAVGLNGGLTLCIAGEMTDADVVQLQRFLDDAVAEIHRFASV